MNKNPYHMTQKQKWIMGEIVVGNVDEMTGERISDLDLDQLLERLAQKYPSYAPTKQALQFSIRFLERKGLIDRTLSEYRRGRRRRVMVPTPTGVVVTVKPVESKPDPGIVMIGFDEDDLTEPGFDWN